MGDRTASEETKITTRDVAIVGAGPVGLFAVFEAGMLGLSCAVIDALDSIGGQCTALYPEKPIYDIPGHPAIDAASLIDALAAQAGPFDPAYVLGSPVQVLNQHADGFELVTADGRSVRARAVVLAAGAGAFGPNRPPLAGIESFEGSSVFYFVRRREDFRDKRVVIAGGGDSAVDWALSLAEVARSVQLVHRRARFRAAPESVARLERLTGEGRVELVVPYQLHGLVGAAGVLEAVEVATLDGEVRRLEADVLLPFYGLATSLGPLAEWGLGLAHGHIHVDAATCATDRPGIWAIGDVATYRGKLKLILTGFAEAAAAAHAVRDHLNPGVAHHFEYSTTRGVPGVG